MTDKKFEVHRSDYGVEITLTHDVSLYQVIGEGNDAAKVAALEKGETIRVGGFDQVIRLMFDHKLHEFTPVLSELESDNKDADDMTTFFVRTNDLPRDF